jgi:hypothetical protein
MNIKNILAERYKKYHRLIIEVESMLREGNQSHGIDHSLMVAQYAAIIAEQERAGELAWVAGIIHDVCHRSGSKDLKSLHLSPLGEFSSEELGMIYRAVRDHSKLNDANDDLVTIILKDADRLANLGLLNIIRGGQHRPEIPSMTLGCFGLHPDSTFRKPLSCLDALHYNLEWEEMLRLPRARALGRQWFALYRYLIATNEAQFREIGLDVWPPQE